MLRKNKRGFYQISELNDLGLRHGFSTVELKDMQFGSGDSLSKIKSFTSLVDSDYQGVVGMNQVHGTNLEFVKLSDKNSIKNETDGLLTKEKGLFLIIKTADCLPIILFDYKIKTIAAIHAGYKGVYTNIVKHTVDKMISLGSDPVDIVSAIGPSIRECCYSIKKDRAMRFKNKYSESIGYLTYEDNKPFLSLQSLVKWQLIAAGLLEVNIFDAMMCTQDHADEFFSFRARDRKDTGEVFATVVGI